MKTIIIIVIYLACGVNVGVAQSLNNAGRQVFETNCAKCHGSAGNKGRFGAKDLTISNIQADAARKIIQNGRNIMPAWGRRLTSAEIDQVIKYIFTLRQRVQ